MPLLNYTTEVPASKSIAEITAILQNGGASAIMLETGPNREVVAVSFMLETSFGRLPFALPANADAVMATINAQIEQENRFVATRYRYRRKIPLNLRNDRPQAERVAWRIAKDWLEAQLALTEIGSAKLEQIMLPFAKVGNGSFYDRLVARGSLALPNPESTDAEKNVTPI